MGEWKQQLDKMSLPELIDFLYAYDKYFKSDQQAMRLSEYFYNIYRK